MTTAAIFSAESKTNDGVSATNDGLKDVVRVVQEDVREKDWPCTQEVTTVTTGKEFIRDSVLCNQKSPSTFDEITLVRLNSLWAIISLNLVFMPCERFRCSQSCLPKIG